MEQHIWNVRRLPVCIIACEGPEAIRLEGLAVGLADCAMGCVIEAWLAVAQHHTGLRGITDHGLQMLR